jgi:Flp pilus assembly protein TadD
MLRTIVSVAMVWLLAGCATIAVHPAKPDMFDDSGFARPSESTDRAPVFAFSPAMEHFFQEQIVPQVRIHGPQQGLVHALYSAQRVRLSYDGAFTRNAAEAFDARAGNCLSLVIMTASFAKRLGLEVRYQRVESEGIWARDGQLVQIVGHVNVALGRPDSPLHRTQSPRDWVTIDFLPIDDAERQRVRHIDEARVVAMYMNNKSVEALARGNRADAYWWSRASIEQDLRFTSAYITLAVVLQQHGLFEKALGALRYALGLEPHNTQALSNLVGNLRGQGREGEAQEAARLLARLEPTTPMASFKTGLRALKTGDFSAAKSALKTALRGAPDDHEFHFLLAVACQGLGDLDEAKKHLQEAQTLSPNGVRRAVYASKLKQWEASPQIAPGTTLHQW